MLNVRTEQSSVTMATRATKWDDLGGRFDARVSEQALLFVVGIVGYNVVACVHMDTVNPASFGMAISIICPIHIV